VLGSFGSAANVPLALATDVTDFRDREIATGLVFAGTNLLCVLLNGLPVLFFVILEMGHAGWESMLLYQVVLCIAYFASLACISMDKKVEDAHARASPPSRPSINSGTVRPTPNDEVRPVKRCGFIRDPLRLMFLHRRLRRLCATAFLLAFSGSVVMSVAAQFHFQSLGLLPYGTDKQLMLVAAVGLLPGQLLVLPGYVLTGYLAKAGGTLRMLRKLIPITATLKLFGVLLLFVSYLWFLPFVVVAESYTGLANVPLMRMVSGCAPPGRMGEALSAAGVSMQVAGFIGNVAITLILPCMRMVGWEAKLWIFYPLCACLHMLAILPVLGKPSRGGWGAASGEVKDQVMANIYAGIAGRRWMMKSGVRDSRSSGRLSATTTESPTESSAKSEDSDVDPEPEENLEEEAPVAVTAPSRTTAAQRSPPYGAGPPTPVGGD